MPTIGFLIPLFYLAFVLFVIWQVISALNRISSSMADIAITLRRMESKEREPGPPN